MSFLSPTLRLENLPLTPIMSLDHVPEGNRYNPKNIVAKWVVPINGKMYRIELEHGTTSGRRLVFVNGKEILRRDWMFKLVGEDTFDIDHIRCIIRVDPAPGFKYDYLLFIDGKPHEKYTEDVESQYRLWVTKLPDDQITEYRIMLKLDTLSLYVNDELCTETPRFVDGGTDTKFLVRDQEFILQARTRGNRLEGLVHTLISVNGIPVPEAKLEEITQEPSSILETAKELT